MINGLYALIRLDGAPLDPADLTALDLPAGPSACSVRLVDGSRNAAPGLVISTDRETFTLLGELDEPGDIASALGLDPRTAPAALVRAAFARWGLAATARLAGEWSFLLWDQKSAAVTLATSGTLRDQMFWTQDGPRLAIAPSLKALARLPWVSNDFDPLGLSQAMCRWFLRNAIDNRPLLKGARRVEHGAVHIIGRDCAKVHDRQPLARPSPWEGDYTDAVRALETRARAVISAEMDRHDAPAILLSGGLDSSLVALMASEATGGRKLTAVSSVSAQGSGIADERPFIDIVVRELGLELIPVTPVDDAEIYVPSDLTFARTESPAPGPRHYLYATLFQAAALTGAPAVMDGQFGEFSLTAEARLTTPLNLLRVARDRFQAIGRPVGAAAKGFDSGFLVRPSGMALGVISGALGGVWPELPTVAPLRRPAEALGLTPGTAKAGRLHTDTGHPDLRWRYPFRDPQLIALAARLPASFTHQNGMGRAMARTLLMKRLPQIAMRADKAPFAPDYRQRLIAQAPVALSRLAENRRLGAEDWIDCNWLEGELRALIDGQPRTRPQMNEIHHTALGVEFFRWWKRR